MDWTTFITSLLASIGGVGILIAFFAFLGKKWVSSRIEETVKHEYAKKLEEYKAQLQAQVKRSVEEMKVEFQDAVDEKAADKALFREFLKALPSNGSIEFIRTHNMAGWSFDRDRLSQLDDFCYWWSKPEYHFLDEELDKKCSDLHNKVDEYLNFIAFNTFPLQGSVTHSSVPEEWEETQPERFHEVVSKLHNLASQIVAAHKDLIKTARKSLKC